MTEKTLEDVCNILPRSRRNTKYGSKQCAYPFFKGTMIVDSFVDSPDYEGESIIIGDGGTPNINYGYQFSASNICYILQNKNKSVVNLKYVYYYLLNNLEIMDDLYIGNGDDVKHISKASIKNIKIPIPPIEKQNEIIEYCENNNNIIKQLKNDLQQYIKNININF
jgi:type I restriction enzyme S subunit